MIDNLLTTSKKGNGAHTHACKSSHKASFNVPTGTTAHKMTPMSCPNEWTFLEDLVEVKKEGQKETGLQSLALSSGIRRGLVLAPHG